MSRKILPVNGWLLDRQPNIVKKLERTGSMMINVGSVPRFKMKNVQLLAPEGITIYRAIGNYKGPEEFFFTIKGEDALSPAYLSKVRPGEGSLNYARNTGTLLEYSWYDHGDSSWFFDRLARGIEGDILNSRAPVSGAHPFLP